MEYLKLPMVVHSLCECVYVCMLSDDLTTYAAPCNCDHPGILLEGGALQ